MQEQRITFTDSVRLVSRMVHVQKLQASLRVRMLLRPSRKVSNTI